MTERSSVNAASLSTMYKPFLLIPSGFFYFFFISVSFFTIYILIMQKLIGFYFLLWPQSSSLCIYVFKEWVCISFGICSQGDPGLICSLLMFIVLGEMSAWRINCF